MALDTNIPLQVKQPQFDNIQDIQARGMQLRQLGQQQAQQAATLQQQNTLRDIYRRRTNATGEVDSAGLMSDVAQAGYGDTIPALQKADADQRHATTQADASQYDLQLKHVNAVRGVLSSVLALPNPTHDDVVRAVAGAAARKEIPDDLGVEIVREIPNDDPGRLRQYLMQQAMEGADHAKRLEMLVPKYDEQDRGGVINQGTVNQMTGERTAGTDIAKTATPGEKLTSAAKAAAAANKVVFTEDEGNLMAALAEHGVALPAGLRSKDQMKATFGSLLSRNPNMTPDDIAEKIATGQINLGAERKESQTAAAQAGRIAVAQNEIKQFVPIARAASKALPRGEFVPWNKLKQMGEEQLSNPQLVEFKAYMNTLSNAYDQLAARGGTDMAKREHNRKMFDTATSPEALEAVFKALETEAAAADVAAQSATRRRGSAPAPHQQNVLPPMNAKGWVLNSDAKGNRAYVSQDGTQFEEVK